MIRRTKYNGFIIFNKFCNICLCIGYVLKNIVTTDAVNKYIPAIMGALGVILNIWMNMTFTPEILLGGLVSGLASTGLYEAFKNFLKK